MTSAELITLVISACIAIFASITAPAILLHRTEAQHREDRDADWKRQDAAALKLQQTQDAQAAAAEEVARRAAQAAENLAASQKDIADRAAQAATDLVASQKLTASTLLDANNKTNGKLDVIHTLVNSNMTTAMENELVSAERELAMMQEVIELKRTLLRQEPTIEALAAIEASKSKIAELVAALRDRAGQSRLAGRGPG
jgi:hypothetical protein